jgi:hypothetical protein
MHPDDTRWLVDALAIAVAGRSGLVDGRLEPRARRSPSP